MGKWIAIALVAVVLIGGLGYVAVRTGWLATAKEDADAWMDEQQLKNFPAVAREEIKKMETTLKETEKSRDKLQLDIALVKGTESMTEEQLKDDSDGWATIKGYELLKKEKQAYVDARDRVCKGMVADIKKQQDDLVKGSNGAISSAAEIDADQKYIVVNGKGTKEEKTLAEAKAMIVALAKEMDAARKDIAKYDEKIKRRTAFAAKMGETLVKMNAAIDSMKEKIADMKEAAKEIEAEIQMAKLEEDLDKINAAIEGKESDSKLGNMIAKFKKSQKEATAARDIANEQKASAGKGADTSDFMGEGDKTGSGSTSADDYWK